MALAIIPADQALNVSAIITYIYADPGLGKTCWGLPLTRLFLLTLTAARTAPVNSAETGVPVQQWADIENIKERDLAFQYGGHRYCWRNARIH